MKAAILSFTGNGQKTAGNIKNVLEADGWNVVENVKCKHQKDSYTGSLKDWTGEQFGKTDAIIYVGAAGIAVRAIAPFVVSKKEDPAVLVVDEQGKYCIPVLSGHIGGANELARKLSAVLSMEAVITTATDLNQKWAVDVFSKKNELYIEDMRLAKNVSAEILAGRQIVAELEPEGSVTGKIPEELKVLCEPDIYESCDWESDYASESKKDSEPEEFLQVENKESIEEHVSQAVKVHIGVCKTDMPARSVTKADKEPELEPLQVLHLVPRAVILGIGCKKGTAMENIEEHVTEVLRGHGILPEAVKLVASIDLKKEEPGLCEYCKKHNIPFQTFSKEELEQAEGTFTGSEFVKQTTGVDNVCERSAMCAGGEKILVHKTAANGVTAAVAVEKWSVNFE